MAPLESQADQAGLGAARRLLRDALEAAEDALGSAGEKVRHMRRQLDEEWSSLEAGREELAAARARVREQLGEAGRTLADLEERRLQLSGPRGPFACCMAHPAPPGAATTGYEAQLGQLLGEQEPDMNRTGLSNVMATHRRQDFDAPADAWGLHAGGGPREKGDSDG